MNELDRYTRSWGATAVPFGPLSETQWVSIPAQQRAFTLVGPERGVARGHALKRKQWYGQIHLGRPLGASTGEPALYSGQPDPGDLEQQWTLSQSGPGPGQAGQHASRT